MEKRVHKAIENHHTEENTMNIYIAKTQAGILGIGYFTGLTTMEVIGKLEPLGFIDITLTVIIKNATPEDIEDYRAK